MQSIPARRISARSWGKMPTTSLRRPTSRFPRSALGDRRAPRRPTGQGRDHAAAVADLLDFRVEKQIGLATLQRVSPERLDVLIERLADAADLALGNPAGRGSRR